jgi:ABC-2 type transport system ATP-binding protein
VTGAVVAERLTKFYGSSRGVEDLSFEARPGEVFGFLGPNGAGKTTTIRLMLDFLRPTRGAIRVLGLDPRRQAREVHARTGYLPGELALYDRLTGEEFLRMVERLRDGAPARRTDELARRFDLDLSKRIRDLSHGNRQKVGLVLAFAHDPELLVLDEPTQGLDPLMQQTFYALVEEARARGATTFLSSHVMPEVERTCDRVAIVRDGRVVTVEDIGSLKAKSLRSIEFHFRAPVGAEAFRGLPGVRDVVAHGEVVRVSVEGPVDAILKAAARFEVVDLVSQEPTLEDVFLAFYGGQR